MGTVVVGMRENVMGVFMVRSIIDFLRSPEKMAMNSEYPISLKK